MRERSSKLIGIDDIAHYVPRLYLDAKELAEARGLDPNYIVKGLGIEKIAILDSYEDAATMAAMATLRLIEKNDLRPKEIDFIHVATESGPDAAKPLSCYVLGMLEQIYGEGSFDHVGSPETKFACVGATYALIDRLAYIASGWNRSKYAIVIATDVAKYDLKSSGESTQGAAAIAILLKKDPRMLTFEPHLTGFGTVDDRDFFRPIERATAIVDGQYSIGCYLRDMRIAVDDYKQNMVNAGIAKSLKESVNDQIDLISFHSPFPKMVEYAFASFLIHDWRSLPKWREIGEEIAPEPDREGLSDVEFYISRDYKAYRKRFTRTKAFIGEYQEKVADSLNAVKLIGNSYTASVWLGLVGHYVNMRGNLSGRRFGIGSYGSGSSAIICSFIVQPEYIKTSAALNLMRDLSQRHKISVDTYEDLHEGRLKPKESILPPENEYVLSYIGNSNIDDGYRYYKFVR